MVPDFPRRGLDEAFSDRSSNGVCLPSIRHRCETHDEGLALGSNAEEGNLATA